MRNFPKCQKPKEKVNSKVLHVLESRNKDAFNFSERKKQFYASYIPKVEFDVISSHRGSSNANSNSKESLTGKNLINYFSIFESSSIKPNKNCEDAKVFSKYYILENISFKFKIIKKKTTSSVMMWRIIVEKNIQTI